MLKVHGVCVRYGGGLELHIMCVKLSLCSHILKGDKRSSISISISNSISWLYTILTVIRPKACISHRVCLTIIINLKEVTQENFMVTYKQMNEFHGVQYIISVQFYIAKNTLV